MPRIKHTNKKPNYSERRPYSERRKSTTTRSKTSRIDALPQKITINSPIISVLSEINYKQRQQIVEWQIQTFNNLRKQMKEIEKSADKVLEEKNAKLLKQGDLFQTILRSKDRQINLYKEVVEIYEDRCRKLIQRNMELERMPEENNAADEKE